MFMLWNSSFAFFLINQSTTVCLLEQISYNLSYYLFILPSFCFTDNFCKIHERQKL